MSLRAAITIPLFTVILPGIVSVLLSTKPAATKDLLIGKVSIVFLTLGSFILFLANSVSTMIIGEFQTSRER